MSWTDAAPRTGSCSASAWRSWWSAALLTTAMVVKSTGRLNDYVRVVADLVNVGDGLPQKSDVKYHGVLVGMVDDVVPAAQRQTQLRPHRPQRRIRQVDSGHGDRSRGAQQCVRRVVGSVGRQRSGVDDPCGGTYSGRHPASDRAVPDDRQQAARPARRRRARPRRQVRGDPGRARCRHRSPPRHPAQCRSAIESPSRSAQFDCQHRRWPLDRVRAASTRRAGSRRRHPICSTRCTRPSSRCRPSPRHAGSWPRCSSGADYTVGTTRQSFDNHIDQLIRITTDFTPVLGVLAHEVQQLRARGHQIGQPGRPVHGRGLDARRRPRQHARDADVHP